MRPPRALPAASIGLPRNAVRKMLVSDRDQLIQLRWVLAGGECSWFCEHHGEQRAAECLHTYSAALVLAEELLGLTRLPQLDPDHTTNHATNNLMTKGK